MKEVNVLRPPVHHLYDGLLIVQLDDFSDGGKRAFSFIARIEGTWEVRSSIADPGCLSWIPDPDFRPSRIPAPKIATKERGEKKIVVLPFFVATKITKLKIILILNWLRKKIWANLQRIIELSTQKTVIKLSKI